MRVLNIPDPHPLPSDVPGVSLWWCDLERTAEDVASLAHWLSPAEEARAARFGTEPLRRRWIAGRTTLRFLLGRATATEPADIAIRRGTRGRPELADSLARIDFNVSHTGGIALIGIASDLPPRARIGVDVERLDRTIGVDRVAQKFMTAREQSVLAELSPSVRKERFLRYWTCKEAMSKATGDGLAAPFRKLDVEVSPSLRLVDGPPPYVPARWSLHRVAMPAGLLGTVAIWLGL
jgi:4'-phosphopantetheinyl transferase